MRLQSTGRFKPMTLRTFADWSLDAGDVVQVSGSERDAVLQMPIFHSDLEWSGAATSELSCTGEEVRPLEKQADRDEQRFRKTTNKKLNSLDLSVSSLGKSVSTLEDNLTKTSLSVLVNLRVSDTGKIYMEARRITFYGSYGSKYDEGYITPP